jgi:hypothetical protein
VVACYPLASTHDASSRRLIKGSILLRWGTAGAVGREEVLLMAEEKEEGREAGEQFRCQIEIAHFAGNPPPSCAEAAKEMVDSLLLCERHAFEAKLEGQIECWAEMLFHIDLWSKEAKRQKKPDVGRLLEDQRALAISANQRACEDLDVLRSETSSEGLPCERTKPSRQDSLPLPPKAARQHFLGLRRLRRR